MPAKSKKQQMAAGVALAAKRGQKKKSSLKGPSKSMYESMNEKQLRDVAKTKRKSLPRKKTEAKATGNTAKKKAAAKKKSGGAKASGAKKNTTSAKKKAAGAAKKKTASRSRR